MAKRTKKRAVILPETLAKDIPPPVPVNGAEAYKAGFTADQCPYREDEEGFEEWNTDWDRAADEAQEEQDEHDQAKALGAEADMAEGDEEEEKVTNSVVKEEYRARYAEAGHPNHCGDELAVLLNNLCLTKQGIDMPRFEHICEANGVDLSKYNRTSKGWQGRLRMTGRNILARKVFEQDGIVHTVIQITKEDGSGYDEFPLEGAEREYKMSKDWMAMRLRKGVA